MNAPGRLTAYGAGLALTFAGAFAAAGVVVPDSAVQARAANGGSEVADHGDAGHATASQAPDADAPHGLALAQNGFLLSPVHAPGAVGETGELSFQVQDATGEAVTVFETSHERDLHLIVVRADGSQFRHVHPTLDTETGTWSIPWRWDEAGTYRVYADVAPATGADAQNVTLTRTVQVAGDFSPVATEPTATDEVDGFTVDLQGSLEAGSTTELTLSVSRDGDPVTTLEPYLGAFGHLVALREGDLAYLHVHAQGEDPAQGDTSGPEISFATEAPSAGRYLLYLDFQVGGQVHTAELVLDASHGSDQDHGEHGGSGH